MGYMPKANTILLVQAVFPPEPVVSAIIGYDLAKELADKSALTVVVVCPKPTRPFGKKLNEFNFSNVKIKRVVLKSFTFPRSEFIGRMVESICFGIATRRYIAENHAKLKYIYMNTWPLFAQYITIRASVKYHIPCWAHIQDVYPESMLSRLKSIGNLIRPFFLRLDSFYMNKCDGIIAISEKMSDYLIKTRKLNPRKVQIIRNWQDESLFAVDSLKDKTKETCFTFMFVGSISPAANLPFFIQTFIETELNNAKLVIAGDGSDKKLCEMIVNGKGVSNVFFQTINPCEVSLVQSKADVLILPLKSGVGLTASPSKLSAYMLSAKPIVASVDPFSDVDFIIKKSDCGWVCKSDNKVALMQCLRAVRNLSAGQLIQYGERGRKYALLNMSKKENLRRLSNVFIKSK